MTKPETMKLRMVGGKWIDAENEYIMVPKLAVDVADYLTKLVPFASPNGFVETEADWKIVVKLFEAFIKCYPAEYTEFITTSNNIRSGNIDNRGYAEKTDMQWQMEIPQRFHQLIKTFYPLQMYDTKFSRRLAKEIPILKATK